MFPANVLRLVTTVKIAKFYYPSLSSLLEFFPHLFSHLSKILNVVLVGQRHRLSLNAQHFSQIKCWGLPPPPHSLYNWLPTREVLVKGGQGWGRPPNFWNNRKKEGFFYECTIQDFVSCSWRCPGYLCATRHTWQCPCSGSNTRGESPWRALCQLNKTFKFPWQK